MDVISVAILVIISSVALGNDCDPKSLAAYNVTFTGLWSKEIFPKQYPLFRPPAQWTKVIGRSHALGYNLFSVDSVASPGVKQFVETGIATIFDRQTQGEEGILDIFTTAAVRHGVGQANAMFYVDGVRSKVSMMARIVPSPDWFVGIDSLELCDKGAWRDSVKVDLEPMDAGTDQGYTFTAPNWPEEPLKPISIISSHFPNHPANSFYYPEIDKLPTLARLEFVKVRTYSWENGEKPEVMSPPSTTPSGVKELPDSTQMTEDEEEDDEEEDDEDEESEIVTSTMTSTTQGHPRGKEGHRRRKGRNGRRGRKGRGRRRPVEHKPKPKEAVNVMDIADQMIDCEVSNWGAWSECSKTCGFGTRTRQRTVERKPRNYGHPCPLLTEDELCGSMRSCNWSHFRGMGKRFRDKGGVPRERTSIFRFGGN